jgi:hypothetical protein
MLRRMLCFSKGRSLFVLCALLAGAPAAFGQAALRINEVLASNVSFVSGGSITDWIELWNTSGATLDISGATITDDELDPLKWTIPDGTSIPANGFIVIACDSERPGSTAAGPFLNTGFSISATGGGIFLYANNFGSQLDAIRFGPQVADFSLGRVGATWQLCTPTPGAGNVATALGAQSGLRVNEWFANGSTENDWFEIFNTGSLPVSLQGLFLTDTLSLPAQFAVPPYSFVGSGQDGFVKYIADSNAAKGPDHVNFSLKASGEAVGIFDATGAKIDFVPFGPQGPDISEGRLPDGSANTTTFPGTASPRASNYKQITSIVVSELLSHTDPPIEDAVEFLNVTDAPIDISGWFLSNKQTELKKYRVPNGTIIPAHAYKVFYENAFNAANPLVPFTFNSAHGDQVYLAQADANGNLTGYRVGEEFEAAEHGISFGRVETSVPGDHKFVAMSSLTFGVSNPTSTEQFRTGTGAPNSPPKIGPIVINEVHYNPASVDGGDNINDQFIELYSIASTNVFLYDPAHPENHWRMQNGISFVFPANKSIPAGGYALIVAFSPSLDPIAAANFRAKWHVPSSVPLYGPFLGDLNNDGDSLELYKPDPPQEPPHPDAGFVPYIRVDKVNYTDRAPWPPGADGLGPSLQRKNPLTFGNDPINWDAADPTPGVANSAALQDSDGDGMTDIWEDQYAFNKFDASDAALDTDADGFTNLQEFIAGTNPRDASSRLKVTRIVPAQSDTIPLTISFNAVAGKSYSVMYRNSMSISASWQKLKTVDPQPSDGEVTVEDTGAWLRTDRYYRIVTPAAN